MHLDSQTRFPRIELVVETRFVAGKKSYAGSQARHLSIHKAKKQTEQNILSSQRSKKTSKSFDKVTVATHLDLIACDTDDNNCDMPRQNGNPGTDGETENKEV